ncbi:MAG: molybdopterin-binding protein, partial [Pseudomonadota bacterium]|nr:molybdopterin-binding protein [Pseudomonadota bacterium]
MPIDDKLPFLPVHIAVMTVSDTRTEADDRSGDMLAERLKADGHILAARTIVKDESDAIEAQLNTWVENPNIDA